MKDKINVILSVSCLFLLSPFIHAENIASTEGVSVQNKGLSAPIIYTIEGKKDPRLSATFLASYISTSKSEACSYKQATIARRKVRIVDKAYPVTEENYRVEIPIFLDETETECGYQFSRIELVLRRLHDNNLYAKHIVLNSRPEARAIYRGTQGGMMSIPGPNRPAKLKTDKKYFRVAKETNYLCITRFYTRIKDPVHSTGLVCHMEIGDGLGVNQFIPTNSKGTHVTHPEFGIDEITNDALIINMIADDENSKLANGKEVLPDYFRVLPKPKQPELKPSLWQQVTNKISEYLN